MEYHVITEPLCTPKSNRLPASLPLNRSFNGQCIYLLSSSLKHDSSSPFPLLTHCHPFLLCVGATYSAQRSTSCVHIYVETKQKTEGYFSERSFKSGPGSHLYQQIGLSCGRLTVIADERRAPSTANPQVLRLVPKLSPLVLSPDYAQHDPLPKLRPPRPPSGVL